MENLKYNGYIIRKKTSSLYKGVEGDNWYLNYCSDNPYFEEYYNDKIDKAWERHDFVDCCSDEEYIKRYLEESQNIGVEFSVLICATRRKMPLIGIPKLSKMSKVLGYDYAYSGGSYYSCILNDIISGRIKEFKQFKLNDNGLFDSYEEAEEFRTFRDQIKTMNNKYFFEEGDFIIYEITEVFI